jgi:hypothetical protein
MISLRKFLISVMAFPVMVRLILTKTSAIEFTTNKNVRNICLERIKVIRKGISGTNDDWDYRFKCSCGKTSNRFYFVDISGPRKDKDRLLSKSEEDCSENGFFFADWPKYKQFSQHDCITKK